MEPIAQSRPLVVTAFEMLTPTPFGPECFVLSEGTEEQLAANIERAARARNTATELQGVLRLIASLQNDLRSPTAAQQLLIALRMAGWVSDATSP